VISLFDNFTVYVVVGALAQLIDGALGMAYGVITTSLLLGIGIGPAATSASVHICKIATGAASGVSHLLVGNVERRLLIYLSVTGAIGGVTGAYLLTKLSGDYLKPFVAAYLLLVGVLIVRKAYQLRVAKHSGARVLGPLGLAGGFLDAVGGGGWGPIVTSSLLARGTEPRLAIGSTNLAECFVALCATTVFLTRWDLFQWKVIAGLVLGGVIAAPIAALVTKHFAPQRLLVLVGVLIIVLSSFTLIRALI
jgi:uncharacterized membrane protein YfcA